MKSKTVALIALFLTVYSLLTAENNLDITQIEFEHITVEDGLSQNTVECILKDKYGYLWFGTQDGLNRYDGYNFKIFKDITQGEIAAEDALSDRYIRALLEDKDGNLWIGTNNGGLNKYDRKTGKFKHYLNNPNDSSSLGSNSVWTIFEDNQGNLWIGTTNGGLNKFDKDSEKFVVYKMNSNKNSISNNSVKAIAQDEDGLLWIGTGEGGVNVFDIENEKFIHYRHNPDNENSLVNDSVNSLIIDSFGDAWIGTKKGLSHFITNEEKFVNYMHDPLDSNSLKMDVVYVVFEDKDKRILIGHKKGGGLSSFDRENNNFSNISSRQNIFGSLSDDYIRTIFQEENGNLWIGTFIGGINKYSPGKIRFKTYKEEWWKEKTLSDNTIRGFYKDSNGNLYIGTERGLNITDSNRKEFEYYINEENNPNSIPHNIVRAVSPDKNGNLWMATHGGLSKLNIKERSFTNYYHAPENSNTISGNELYRVLVDSQGLVWSGGKQGLNVLNPGNNKIKTYRKGKKGSDTIIGDRILAIYEDSREDIWVASSLSGLNHYDRKNNKWTHYVYDPNDNTTISSNAIFSILDDEKGNIWVGTRVGLNKLKLGTNKFQHYTEKDGLSNNTIYGILMDKAGNLWMSTNRGISVFNPMTEEFRNYSILDGLQNNEFNNGAFYKAADGEMFFGGVAGFNAFFPEKIVPNDYTPPIVITGLRVINRESDKIITEKPLEELKEITLDSSTVLVSFDFASLDYRNPGNIEYAYMMEGINNDFIYSGNRNYVEYSNLKPGNYIFRIKATNSDKIWSPNEKTIKVTMLPPIWRTTGAYILYSILVIILLDIVLINLQKRVKEKREKERLELERQTNEKIKNLLDNAGQGFLTIDKGFKIEEGYSAECELLLGKNLAGKDIAEVLFSAAEEENDISKDIFTSIFNDTNNDSKKSVMLSLLPDSIIIDDKNIAIQYKLIYEKNDYKIMLILTDITEKINLQENMEKEREKLLMLVKIIRNLDEFKKSVKNSLEYFRKDIFQEISDVDRTKIFETFRKVHTYKGDFSQWYMNRVVSKLNDLEDYLVKIRNSQNDIEIAAFLTYVINLNISMEIIDGCKIVEESVGKNMLNLESDNNIVIVDKVKLIELENKIKEIFNPEMSKEILKDIRKLRYKKIENFFDTYKEYADRISRKLEKREINFQIKSNGILIDEDIYYDLFKSFVHIIRNIIDHGLERAQERIELNKSENGVIEIETLEKSNFLMITIKDDGRGLNIEKIKEKVLENGVMRREELDELDDYEIGQLIFMNEISTKDKVTNLSGRGIGLSAVKNEVEKLNGTIEVISKTNVGTIFVIEVPYLY